MTNFGIPFYYLGSRRTDGKEQEIIVDDLITEIKSEIDENEQIENEDIFIITEDDPLVMEALANNGTRQNNIEDLIEMLGKNIENDDNVEVVPNIVDLSKWDTGQNQNKKEGSGQSTTDNSESFSSVQKEKDTNNKTSEQKKQEIDSNSPNEDDIYNDDNDDDFEKNKKKSLQNEKRTCQPIRYGGYTVFERVAPKADFADTNTVSNSSVDCGHINNRDEIHKIDTIQNYEEKYKNDERSTEKYQSSVESVVHERNKGHEVVDVHANKRITDVVDTISKKDTNNVNKQDFKQKYQDYDIFKGPTPKNWREKREAELYLIKNREGMPKRSTDSKTNKNSRENKQTKADDNEHKGSRDNKSTTEYISNSSRENKSVTDYQSKNPRKNIQSKDDDNQNVGSAENISITSYESRTYIQNKMDVGYTNCSQDNYRQNVLDDLNDIKATGKSNKYGLNNDEPIEKEPMEKDEIVTKKPHRRTLLDDLKYKRLMEMKNSGHDSEGNVPPTPFPPPLPPPTPPSPPPPPPRRKLLDDLRSKKEKEKADTTKEKSGNTNICGEDEVPRRLLDYLKYKSKEKTYRDIVNNPFRAAKGKVIQNMGFSTNSFESSKGKEYQDIFQCQLRPEKDESLGNISFSSNLPDDLNKKYLDNIEKYCGTEKEYKNIFECQLVPEKCESLENFSSNLPDDLNKKYLDNIEKYCGTGEISNPGKKYGDSNTFKDENSQEKKRRNSNYKESKHKRDRNDNKGSGCDLLDEPKNKNSKEKNKTDTSDKRFKEKRESVGSKSSQEKLKKSQKIDNDRHSKHKRDDSNYKKSSERKSSRSSKNKTSEESKKSTKGLVADGLEKRQKDSISTDVAKHGNSSSTDVAKHGNVKDVNKRSSKEAVKRKSNENTEDVRNQSSSHASSDVVTPTCSKRVKTDKEISTKDYLRSKFDDLFEDGSEQSSDEENFKAKILKARSLKSGDDDIDTSKRKLPQNEFRKHVDNIKIIMRWTNATPIRRFNAIGYECAFCEVQCHKPADLKMHTLENHHSFSTAYFIKKVDMSNYFVKLDITDLECYICSAKIHDVNTVINHLFIRHKKKLHRDIKNHIVPFKFDSNDLDTLTCFLCGSRHTFFKNLLEHTITMHCRNYICRECHMGFVNVRKLQYHLRIHDNSKGTFKCDYCDKTCDTLLKKNSHEKIHRQTNARCAHCGESFPDFSRKQRHLIEVHGIEQPRIICKACDRVFAVRIDYIIHMKRDHLLERKYSCTECEMVFFKSSELRFHMVTHTCEKGFQCNVCYRMFVRKGYLVQHMRGHNDERRFVCDRCGKMFVRKDMWRGHMINVHKENV